MAGGWRLDVAFCKLLNITASKFIRNFPKYRHNLATCALTRPDWFIKQFVNGILTNVCRSTAKHTVKIVLGSFAFTNNYWWSLTHRSTDFQTFTGYSRVNDLGFVGFNRMANAFAIFNTGWVFALLFKLKFKHY